MSEKKFAGLYWTKEAIDSGCEIYAIHIAVTNRLLCTIDTDVPGAEAFVNLFTAASDLLEALQAFVDVAPSEGHRCLYCDADVYGTESTDEHLPDCEMTKGYAAIGTARGEAQQTPEQVRADVESYKERFLKANPGLRYKSPYGE